MTPEAKCGRRAQASLLWLAAVGCGDAGRPPADPAADAETAVPEAERFGGTAVVGSRVSVATLNPLVTTDVEQLQLQQHVLFMTLVREGEDGELQPYLAESWELNEDSTQIEIRLRDDVFWHDGVPTTAHDVAFTFETVKNPDVAFPNRAWFDHWEGVEVVDGHTIRFVLRPHAEFMHAWNGMAIVPRHILGDTPAGELETHPFGTEEPVGNGPFRFVAREGSDRWVFEANPDFPEELGGRPYLDRLIYRVIPEETALLAELRTGGVHLAWDIPPGQIARIEEDPSTLVVTRPTRTYSFIAWNSLRPQFSDPAVRRALTMAIDREGLLAATREGLGTVTAGPLGPWHPAWYPPKEPLPFDPDSAAGLLEAAGWVDKDGDGVRERDGTDFRFELVTNPNQVREDIAVIVQGQLASVGVGADTRTIENAALGAAVFSPERRYEALILGWEQDPVVDERDFWACDRIGQPFQMTSYCNPELDQVLDSIPITLDDEARLGLYRRYNEIMGDDQPFTFLFFERSADGLRRELRGVRLDPRGELAGVADWWLDGPAGASTGD